MFKGVKYFMICYDYIKNYLKEKSYFYDEKLNSLRVYAEENNVPIISKECENLLLLLGKLINPYRILEIGTAIGYSAILLSSILIENGRLDTIEKSDKMIRMARENVKDFGLTSKINIIEGDAIEVLNFLEKKYDIIFLDGAKAQYIEFLPHIKRLLRDNGLLISDNVLYKGMIADDRLVKKRKITIVRNLRKYIDEITNGKCFITSVLPVGDGIALSYKVDKIQ